MLHTFGVVDRLAGALCRNALTTYRATLKSYQPIHRTVYAIMSDYIIPAMESVTRFETPREDPLWFRWNILTGNHEPETVKWIRQFLKPGMTFLDVGAHVGYYSRLCSALVGPGGRVVAFEPHPITFATLHRNVRGLRNVATFNMAASDCERPVTLFDFLVDSGGSSLREDTFRRNWHRKTLEDELVPWIRKGTPGISYRINSTTIDTCLEKMKVDEVELAKIDIEGSELTALQGMKNTIAHSPSLRLIVEFSPCAQQNFGHSPKEFIDAIRELGFCRISMITPMGESSELDPPTFERITATCQESLGQANLVFERN